MVGREQIEQGIIAALMASPEGLYGVPIMEHLEKLGYTLSIARLYWILAGMENKGLVHCWWEAGGVERGFRRKRMYQLIK